MTKCIKRQWVLVEDDEDKLSAYLQVFDEWRDEKEDILHVLYFPHINGETFQSYVEQVRQGELLQKWTEIPSWCTHSTVKTASGLKDEVIRLSNRHEPLIVLLDVKITSSDGTVIQSEESVAKNWEPIENKIGQHIIMAVTSAAESSRIVRHFPHKGIQSDREVTGENLGIMRAKAKKVIDAAHQEWINKYDLLGNKLVYALMRAGNECNVGSTYGHIHEAKRMSNDFPFREDICSNQNATTTFKALFCYSTERVIGDHQCNIDTLCSIMNQCGIPFEKGECVESLIVLPVAPGALFLFRLCYLIQLLNQEEYDNPVKSVLFCTKTEKLWSLKLLFEKSIENLKDGKGATKRALNSLASKDFPFESTDDGMIKKVFEYAATTEPRPASKHVEYVKKTPPSVLSQKGMNIEIKEKFILISMPAIK